jgi:sarcosine oxidase
MTDAETTDTERADTHADVIVVGVGGMGSAATSHLARQGLDVIGLERYDIPHSQGSSHGLTRIIRLPQYEGPAYVPLVRRAMELWQDLDRKADASLLHQVGSVDFSHPDCDLASDSERSCEVHDIPHEVLSGADLSRRFPGYEIPEEYRAVYQPDGGFLHAEQCTVAHVQAAHRHGATVRARESVEDWHATESGVRVTTDRGSYAADTMVVTAGAWTGQLLPAFSEYLEPERQVLGWFQPQVPEFDPDGFPVFVGEVPEGHYYGFPVYNVPGFKLGKFNHRNETGTPAELKREPDREDERLLREFTESYFPEAAGPTMRLSTCMFTNTPDEDFIIDRHPNHHNVVVGAGFSGHGFKFASVVGEVLASIAVDDEPDQDLDLFDLSRFE